MGAGNFIFGLLLFSYAFCTLFRMRTGAGQDGLGRGTLDDVFYKYDAFYK
jgi:hypothetical protein